MMRALSTYCVQLAVAEHISHSSSTVASQQAMQRTSVIMLSLLCAMLAVTAAFRPTLKSSPRSYLNSVSGKTRITHKAILNKLQLCG
jgi:hypothetical protein